MPRRRKTKEEYVSQSNDIHNGLYDYSLFDYKGYKVKGVIVCKIHGNFEQTFDGHIHGKGCSKCGILKNSKNRNKGKEEFVKQSNSVHSNFYSYKDVVYVDWKTKVKIKCPKHGVFEQVPNNHTQGVGCHKCSSGCRTSKGEVELFEFVQSVTEELILTSDRIQIKPKELDIYIPNLKIAFEFNGYYWHSVKVNPDENHRDLKTKLCKEKGITLIHVEEMDWKNKKNMVKNKIKSLINKHKEYAK